MNPKDIVKENPDDNDYDISHSKNRIARHRKLLDTDENVKRWYNNVARGSKLTADVKMRRLGLFCERNNITPQELVNMGQNNIRQLEDLLLDDVTRLENLGKAPSYIDGFLKTVRSWLSYNYVKTVRKIKIKNSDVAVTLENETIPTREQLDQVMNSTTPRTRAIICLMAFSGIRPEVLGMYQGIDGLKVSDVEGLKVSSDGKISFDKIPAKVTVRRSLSKAGHPYFTFLPKVGCDSLAGYLKERISNGELVTENSPIITEKRGHYYNKKTIKDTKFLNTATITKDVRQAFGGTLKQRPYVLRSYFDSHLNPPTYETKPDLGFGKNAIQSMIETSNDIEYYYDLMLVGIPAKSYQELFEFKKYSEQQARSSLENANFPEIYIDRVMDVAYP